MTDTDPPREPTPAPQPFIIRDARHPIEVIFFAASAVSGIGGFVAPQRSTALAHLLPGWELFGWYAGLILFGALGLLAAAIRFPASLLVERVALLGFTGLLVGQGIAIFAVAATPTAWLTLGFGAGCLWRAVQITRDLTRLHEFLRDHRDHR